MKQRKDIERKIDEAMNSLDSVKRAAPQSFFYTRLMARINKSEHSWSGVAAGFISRPVFALATIFVILFVNGWILYKNNSDIITSDNNAQTIINTDLPDEYNLAVSTTIYNYETP
jgi:hypothetical protein